MSVDGSSYIEKLHLLDRKRSNNICLPMIKAKKMKVNVMGEFQRIPLLLSWLKRIIHNANMKWIYQKKFREWERNRKSERWGEIGNHFKTLEGSQLRGKERECKMWAYKNNILWQFFSKKLQHYCVAAYVSPDVNNAISCLENISFGTIM